MARLAASRGVSTALADASDFGSGASSNTSKLIHGGLRYLETGDFGLVRDSVRERARLLALAPHLVRRERFLFPLCRFGRHGRLAAKAGMVLYDILAGSPRFGHGYVPAEELARIEPHFLPGEHASAYAYGDCVMDDARLALETILDAEALGAAVWNYHRVAALESSGSGWEITVEDRLTGREKLFTARRVALTLGAWTDTALRRLLGEDKNRVRLSQGSHLVMEGIPAHSCFILPVPGSRRYFFVIPFRGLHLVGTTEVELADAPGTDPRATAGETRELLELARRYFPESDPKIVATFAGIRPLAAGSGSTITLSREHEFHRVRDGLFAAVGGKYTTHRVLARDFFCFIFGERKSAIPLCERPYPDDRPAELAKFISGERDGTRLLPGGAISAGEVRFSVQREHCRTAVDFFRRRTGWYFTPGAGLEALDEVERILAETHPSGISLLGEEGDYRAFLKRHEHRAAG